MTLTQNETPVKLFQYKKPLELFNELDMVKICAPMVRYTKLQFRQLVRKYDCDLCYTPMIIANSFSQSQKARDCEFTTNEFDRPLIVQFAANTSDDLATATRFVMKYSDGVELNCGCPQRWAIQEGLGSALIEKNDLICEMIKETRKRIQYDSNFTIACKIRLHENIKQTIDLVQKLESVGCSYLTIHARTKHERHEPIHLDLLQLAAEHSNQMPIVANGDLFTLDDCKKICTQAKLKGVMCARGLLENPALFAGYTSTPVECIRDWVEISLKDATPFAYFHSTLSQMLQHVLSKTDRRYFNTLYSTSAVIDYLNENVFFNNNNKEIE